MSLSFACLLSRRKEI